MKHFHYQIKGFPSPDEDELDGVDATVSEGRLDLKVKNNTNLTFQIKISLNGPYIYGSIFIDQAIGHRYEIINREKSYFKKDGKTFERVSVCQQKIDIKSKQVISKNLFYVAVLFGGCSTEYEVSLQSAYSVITNLNHKKYEAILIDITRQGAWLRYYGSITHGWMTVMKKTWLTCSLIFLATFLSYCSFYTNRFHTP